MDSSKSARPLLRAVLMVAVGVSGSVPLGFGASKTLEKVKKKGFIQCGVSQGLAGFSYPDAKNNWKGIDVDFCRAVAAATLGDASKVKYTPLSAKERFTALQSGEVDLLSRNTTWTTTRDTALGLDFAGVTYYDGQGFMVRESSGVKSAKELDGTVICVQSGTTTELNVADYFRTNNMKFQLLAMEKNDEVVQAYDAKRCDVFTTDQSGLYATRIKLKKPDDHIVLPEVISKEPLGPVVRHGDAQWADIVRWTHYAMLSAEEYGVNSANVDKTAKTSKDPNVKRLLGVEGDLGTKLLLPKDWAHQIIKQVGNYSETFEANVGKSTPLNISRGLNALWSDGGLQYAMPIR